MGASSSCEKVDALPVLLWLSPIARDALRSISKLLRGEVPCPPAKLAELLTAADAASQCEGLLADATVRKDLAAKLKSAAAPKDISDANAKALVDLLGCVLKEELDAAMSKAQKIAGGLPASQATASYKDIVASLPKGSSAGEALKLDWGVWHTVGHAHDGQALPQLDAEVLKERIAILVACGSSGPLTDFIIGAHVLTHADAYVAWEVSIPGSQKPDKSRPREVLFPFDTEKAKEIAIRRVLGGILPVDVATEAATHTSTLKESLEKLMGAASSHVVIPLYSAPPAPAEKKEPKDKKAKEDGGEKGGKDKGGAKAAKPAAGTDGPFGDAREATKTQELQWQLLRYRLYPNTTLSSAAPAAGGGGAAAAQRVSNNPVAKITGIGAVWAPQVTNSMPPGHTQYSWMGVKAEGMKGGFPCTWEPLGSALPPGHTDYSWENVAGNAGQENAKSSSAAPKPKAEAKEKAAAAAPAKGKAAAAAPAAAGEAPPDGSIEAALCKLDIRCGRILTCEPVPDSEKLFLLSVNIGDDTPRQVITGLQKHYKAKDLKNRLVVVYCNIKPGKLAGYESQAMVLAATKDKGTDNEVCQLLEPPAGCKEGTRPMCGKWEVGCISAGVNVKKISTFWGQVTPLLLANDSCQASFDGTVLTMPEGPVTTGTLTGVPIS